MVSLLEKRGILRRKPSPTDGRARLLYMTAHGQNVMQRLADDWDPMRKILFDCFAGESGRKALQILDSVYEAMQRERERLIRSAEQMGEQSVVPIEQADKPQEAKPPALSSGIRSPKRNSTAFIKAKIAKPVKQKKTGRPQKPSLTN
jgi:hypothetical protein